MTNQQCLQTRRVQVRTEYVSVNLALEVVLAHCLQGAAKVSRVLEVGFRATKLGRSDHLRSRKI